MIDNNDVVPHTPPEEDGYLHAAQQVWYHPDGMQQYSLCAPESPKCSDSIPDYRLSPDAHLIKNYLKMNPNGVQVAA